jgi:hypothetical protein
MIYYLYVKTHRKTGLKYLGQTSRDPEKYRGSGVSWMNHLKEYGFEIDTQILFETSDKSERNRMGRYYSDLWNVAESDEWANRIPETGAGGGAPSGKRNAMYGVTGKDHPCSRDQSGLNNCHSDTAIHIFEHIETGIRYHMTRYEFKKLNIIFKTGVDRIVTGGLKSYKGWRVAED